MSFAELAARWLASLRIAGVDAADYGEVVEGGRAYPLLVAAVGGACEVVVTAGFHGDEKAGPLTLAAHAHELFDEARARGVGLRLYPCVNPSGFELHTRYNAGGERPNNDFLRYEVAPGVWRGELHEGETPLSWRRHDGGPRETVALARELGRHAPPVAALDLHQDNFIHGHVFYSYVFGDRAPYRPLQARSGALMPVLRNALVDSGYEPGTDVRADADGFIECHDGSVTDAFHRAGVAYTAAIETTTDTPAALADEINLIWIRGFIELAARELAARELATKRTSG
ncbi:MAG TPA: succinylglutamate desuccinylase/aspartoacylase family protein [Polyangia bacterium]|nr:succinylglutamate desuccinylase/aspartoacylase family protein [Polyangia bacterium]